MRSYWSAEPASGICRWSAKIASMIGPEAPLTEAGAQLYAQHRGCLPVMDGERVIGIITRRDLLRFANDVLTGVR